MNPSPSPTPIVVQPTNTPVVTPTAKASPIPTVTPRPTATPISGQKKKIKIIHFSDLGGESPWTMYNILKYYNDVAEETYFFKLNR